jgi:hypothetical protein
LHHTHLSHLRSHQSLLLSFYITDCSNIASTDSSDLGCTKGLVTVQPGSALDPIVHTLIQDLLSMPSQRQLLYKVVDGQVTDEEGRVHTQYGTQRDSDISRGRSRGRSGTGPGPISKGEEIWLVPVRTARTVLGVLKITLKSNRKKSSGDLDESMNPSLSKISFSPGLKSEVSGEGISDRKDRSLAAQNALVTYSELIAPLLCAASLIEEEKETKSNAVRAAGSIVTVMDMRDSLMYFMSIPFLSTKSLSLSHQSGRI